MSDTLLPPTADDAGFVPTGLTPATQADVLSEDHYRPTVAFGALTRPRRTFQVLLEIEVSLQALLLEGERDWDGYGARPASAKAISRASRLLDALTGAGVDAPRLGLLSDGGVRAEWRSRQGEVWIDIPEEAPVELYAADSREDLEWEGALADTPDWALALLPRV